MALRLMRFDQLSASEACRLSHIKLSTFKKLVGNAVRQDKPGGRLYAAPTDRLSRELYIPTPLGMAPVTVRGSRQASILARYMSAVGHYLRTGDESMLAQFRKKSVAGHKLIIDPQLLSALAEADALRIDQLYTAIGGTA